MPLCRLVVNGRWLEFRRGGSAIPALAVFRVTACRSASVVRAFWPGIDADSSLSDEPKRWVRFRQPILRPPETKPTANEGTNAVIETTFQSLASVELEFERLAESIREWIRENTGGDIERSAESAFDWITGIANCQPSLYIIGGICLVIAILIWLCRAFSEFKQELDRACESSTCYPCDKCEVCDSTCAVCVACEVRYSGE